MKDVDMQNIKIEVIVKGPGGIINSELMFIEKALRKQGYNVEVKNDNPESETFKQNFIRENKREPTEQELETLLKDFEERSLKTANKVDISLKAEHLPWGG